MENLKKTNEHIKSELRALQKKIKKIEHYYRTVMNCIHDDILIIDKNYLIADVNKNFIATCGRKREDVIGRFCYEVSHGFDEPCDQKGEHCPLKNVFQTGQPHSAWHQHFHSGGWKTWVDIRMSPLTDDNGNISFVVKSIRDVTELVKAGKSLEESDEKYRRIVAATRD